MAFRAQLVLYGFAFTEHGGEELVALADLHGAIASVRRSDQAELATLFRLREILLVVRGLQSLRFREHPDLIEMHRIRLGGVELAVRNPRPRAHILNIARLDYRAV